jgi:hypothetical protein
MKNIKMVNRRKLTVNCHAFKLGISSEQDARKDFVIIDIKV